MHWYESAAFQGHMLAARSAGALYYPSGKISFGLEQDGAKSRYWYFKAAELGDPLSQSNLAHMEYAGIGGSKDLAGALKLFRNLAANKSIDETLRADAHRMLQDMGAEPPAAKDVKPDKSYFAKNWLFIIIGSGIVLAVIVGVRVSRKKPTIKSDAYPAVFTPALKARFPDYHIYFVPGSAFSDFGLNPEEENWALSENLPDRWNAMLSMYPKPPADELERKQREEAFWQRYAAMWTVTNSTGQQVLSPKQNVLDGFKYSEKWVFRDFYAATGIVHETIMKEAVYRREAAVKLYRERDAETRFENETFPAHMEKWGEWFFFHIQDAFGKMTTDAKQRPDSPTTRRDHPARDHLRYRPNA